MLMNVLPYMYPVKSFLEPRKGVEIQYTFIFKQKHTFSCHLGSLYIYIGGCFTLLFMLNYIQDVPLLS